MNLVIDIGNTVTKYAVFEEQTIIFNYNGSNFSISETQNILKNHQQINAIIICSVKNLQNDTVDFLKKTIKTIFLDHNTPVPINNKYKSQETLGKDRLAAVIGASTLYPNSNCLVVDAGTCITFDFIDSEKNYFGGAISPGMEMRFKALHNFTDKLPLVNFIDFNSMIGENTQESILSGVINGVLGEINWWNNYFKQKYPDLITIVCGGNADFFADRLKSSIFAHPNLVLEGLNEILNYNEHS